MAGSNSFKEKLRSVLERRRQEDHLRSLPAPSSLIDFTSNDYLGLARSEELFRMIGDATQNLSTQVNGSTGSRLLSGNSDFTMHVESELARRFKGEAALLFNSGYAANLAVLSSLPSRGDTLIYDDRVHASIKDGARLSLAHRFPFRHNDLNDLEERLKAAKGQRFIIVESIYSMDGDESPLNEIATMAGEYNAALIIDEAHSTGIRGKGGSGMAVAANLHDSCAARIYTFGKAMGIHGACAVGSRAVIDYLVNFARPFIYTTALPPHTVAAIGESFRYLDKHPELQQLAADRVVFYGEQSKTLNTAPTNSTIQTIVIPGNTIVRAAAKQLQHAGFDVRPILSPTVKEGAERLRVCLHTYNTEKEIADLVTSLRTFAG